MVECGVCHLDYYPLWDNEGNWITDAEKQETVKTALSPLDLDNEFKFIEK